MSVRLPVLIDPLQYAAKGLRVEGPLRISDFERLKDRLANTDGEMYASLQFDTRDGQAIVTGSVKGHIYLICQRCMEPMQFDIDTDVQLGIVQNDQEIDALLEGFEPLMAQQEPMKLQEIIEDEVMLLLPMIPFHEGDTCINKGITDEKEPEPVQQEKENPFAVLGKLKLH